MRWAQADKEEGRDLQDGDSGFATACQGAAHPLSPPFPFTPQARHESSEGRAILHQSAIMAQRLAIISLGRGGSAAG